MSLGKAPQVTEDLIDSKILNASFHVFEGTQTTVCILTLENGFTVTGESACVSPENFDVDIGKNIAYANAKNKIWTLEGYLLKEQLYIETECKPDIIYQYQEMNDQYDKLCQEIHVQNQLSNSKRLCKQLKKQRKCIKQYLQILYNRMVDEGIVEESFIKL